MAGYDGRKPEPAFTTLADVREALNAVRALLDDADDVKFGQMGKHLDKMAEGVDSALSMLTRLGA